MILNEGDAPRNEGVVELYLQHTQAPDCVNRGEVVGTRHCMQS